VLQLLAQVIYRLWKDGNADSMILPGALPLYDPAVRNKCLDYLPQGWDPVIDQDVDGEHSKPAYIEGRQPLIGKIQGARRVARALFLGSAPASGGRAHKGIDAAHLLLGVAQPGQSLGHYKDALRHLVDQLNYLNQEAGRYWLDITPNLRREAESRKGRFTEKDDITPLLGQRVQRMFGNQHHFAGIHVFTPAGDVPDEYGAGPRLVALPPDAAYRKGNDNPAEAAAQNILTTRGEQPRQKQNRLLFLAADFDSVTRLRDQARGFLAWQSIVSDAEEMRLVLDNLQLRQARKNTESADQTLGRMVRDAYRWLLNPFQDVRKGRLDPTIRWEAVAIAPGAPNIMVEIEQKLQEQEWLIKQWSPVHLSRVLESWYFKDGAQEVTALKVWQDSCAYLYLPRLLNDAVFKEAIAAGLESGDFFGYASGKDGERYLAFKFGQAGLVTLDEDSLLIARHAAASYKAARQAPQPTTEPAGGGAQPPGPSQPGPAHPGPVTPPTPPAPAATKHYFYGTVTLDPTKAKLQFGDIEAEVLQHFASDVDTVVTITLEVQAHSDKGFSDQTQRIVRENTKVLKFDSAEFEEGEG
jgi:predicted AAA+ superfamily ATPase